MNYEKIIVELLGRIQELEERVEKLEQKEDDEKESVKMTTEGIRQYIKEQKRMAKESGKSVLVLRSGDIHKDLELKNTMPSVCNAMRQSMNEGDVVLHTTPSGNSSTIEIEYRL